MVVVVITLNLTVISHKINVVPDRVGITVAQLVEPGFKSGSGKNFFGVFKDGDLEYNNRFMAAHIALREKLFFGQKSYLNQKLYFLK